MSIENNNFGDYRKKIASLSPEEQFARDLYLRGFHTGETAGPLSGDIFLDRPWTKNYKANPVEDVDLSKTLYQNFKAIADKYPDNYVLFDLLGNKMCYRELLNKVDAIACAFEKKGLKENDKVAILSANSIDEAISLLALNKLGIMAKFVDFSKSIADIQESICETDIKCIIIDEHLLEMALVINKKNVPIFISGTTRNVDENNMASFPILFEIGRDKVSNTACFSPDRPSVMITSSGTTGRPKPIVHTDLSVNSAAKKVLYTDYPLGDGNVMLKTIPAHIGLGIITTLYTSLVSNNKIVFISGNGPEDSVKNFVSFISNYKDFALSNGIADSAVVNIFTAPMFCKALAANIDSISDMSFIGIILAAGAKMTEEELETLFEVFKEKGYSTYIYNGYGQNEMGGAVTLNSNSANLNGSAGFPVIGTEVRILDPDTNEILGIGCEGRIVERASSNFLQYENMNLETQNAFIRLEDGSVWFNTNDKGIIDSRGFLSVTGRLSRVMVRHNCKISIESVEEKIRSLSPVKDCAIVALNNCSDGDDIPFLFLSLQSESTNFDLYDALNNEGKSLAVQEKPLYILKLNNIPYMNNGKIDYVMLTNLANEHYSNEKKKKSS